MKRTKIICTIGPASMKPSTLVSMMRAGMNVARLNLSHGTYASHRSMLRAIRAAAKKVGKPVAVLADLQGPKIRLGTLPEAGVLLRAGASISFDTKATGYREGVLPVTYARLHADVKAGHRILIDDGLLEVRVDRVAKTVIHATVVNGGIVTSHKGMNFPDTTLRVPALTPKDRKDVVFAVQAGVDMMALSFVTHPKDVRTLRSLIRKAAKRGTVLPQIIVKIEKHEAVKQFAAILAEADGVMVARGDLGVEIAAEHVPIVQKEIIHDCRAAGKPVIVATQMLDSMIRNPRPTRAEVSDVANAVFDHTDAVMLSGETATGKYPLATVRTMAKIVEESEASSFDDVAVSLVVPTRKEAAIARAIHILADAGTIEAAAAHVSSVSWAQTLLSERPQIPLVLACADAVTARQMMLRWGVVPVVLSATPATTLARRLRTLTLRTLNLSRTARIAFILGEEHGSGFDVLPA